MSIFWIAWEIFINFVEYYFFYYMVKKQLCYYQHNKSIILAGLGVLVAVVTIMNFLSLDFRAVMLIMFILMLIYTCTLFNGTISMRVIFGSCGIIVILTANLLVSVILTLTSSIAIGDTLSPSLSRLGATALYATLCVVLYLALSKMPHTTVSLPKNLQIFIIVVITAGTIFAGQIVSLAIIASPFASEQGLLVSYSFSLLCMLYAIVFLVHKIGEVIQREAETDHKLQSLNLEQKNFERQQEMMRIWDHEHHHHIDVLQTYISQNDIGGADAYLHKMRNDFDAVTVSVNTGNTVIDAIISSKLRVCQSKSIPFHISMVKLDSFPLAETETSSLFGNLLDNSIEACELCRQGASNEHVFIDLCITKKRGIYMLALINSSNGQYRFKDGQLTTTKLSGHHGYGVPRVKQIIDDAGGFYHFTETKNRFKVDIYLSDSIAREKNR